MGASLRQNKNKRQSQTRKLKNQSIKSTNLVGKLKKSKPKKKLKKNQTQKITKHENDFFIQLGQTKWPLERDILFRPDRLKYVRKLIKEDGCVFCSANHKTPSFETLCVYQTEYSMILLNKFPYNSGHLLIIPREHVGDLLELEQDAYQDLQNTVRLAMKALRDLYQPGGMNLGLNHGAVAGAGIPEHLHYHLIPRWFGDLNFFPLIAETKTMVESLEQTFTKLTQYFGGKK